MFKRPRLNLRQPLSVHERPVSRALRAEVSTREHRQHCDQDKRSHRDPRRRRSLPCRGRTPRAACRVLRARVSAASPGPPPSHERAPRGGGMLQHSRVTLQPPHRVRSEAASRPELKYKRKGIVSAPGDERNAGEPGPIPGDVEVMAHSWVLGGVHRPGRHRRGGQLLLIRGRGGGFRV